MRESLNDDSRPLKSLLQNQEISSITVKVAMLGIEL
jgi:hypothetical protein